MINKANYYYIKYLTDDSDRIWKSFCINEVIQQSKKVVASVRRG